MSNPYIKKDIFVVETWILFRKNDEVVVSNAIQEAYQHYEAMEFENNKEQTKISNQNKRIKLIDISGKMVLSI